MLLMECESGFRQDETTHKFVGLTLPYHFRGIMLYWGSMKPTGHSYFVLCYLTYLSVVAFNGVGGVYRLRIAGVYWKCSVRRSQLSHHDFMTMGYVSPHLLSSVSNCVSAVSLLTAPYTVLRSRRNSFWCLLPMCLIELRIWWTIQSWTLVSGNTLCMASGKPFRPSMQHISISRTPLFWRSLRTSKPKLAPSLLEKYHNDIYIPKDTILSIARIVILSKKQFIFSVFIIFA